jgi:quinol monooxygenase YgiN
MTYALINRLTAKPGRRDEVVANLLDSGASFADDDACLLYLVAESTEGGDAIWVVDLWTSEERHAEALQGDDVRSVVKDTLAMLEGPPEQFVIRPRGGKHPEG